MAAKGRDAHFTTQVGTRREAVHHDMGSPEMLGEQAEDRRLGQRWLFKELEEGWGSDRREGPEVGAMNGATAAG